MKVQFFKADLQDALKKVGYTISAKAAQILTYVKIEATGDAVTITGGSYDITTVVNVEAEVKASGAVLVPFKQLNDFIKKSKAQSVIIEQLDDQKVNVQAANIDYKLNGTDASSYPQLPHNLSFEQFNFDVNEWKRIIANTTFAVATSDSRPMLKAVNVTSMHKKLTFVATDSHRLGLYTSDIDYNGANFTPDGDALNKAFKMIDKKTTNIALHLHKEYTLVTFDNVQVWIKNIEGNYPDTSRLIPDSFSTYATIDSAETLESLSMLQTIAAHDRNNVVRMELNGKIELTASAPEFGEMNATLQGEKQGEDLKISYSAMYMTEALKALNSDNVHLKFVGGMRPFVATTDDQKAIQLILPVRTA